MAPAHIHTPPTKTLSNTTLKKTQTIWDSAWMINVQAAVWLCTVPLISQQQAVVAHFPQRYPTGGWYLVLVGAATAGHLETLLSHHQEKHANAGTKTPANSV